VWGGVVGVAGAGRMYSSSYRCTGGGGGAGSREVMAVHGLSGAWAGVGAWWARQECRPHQRVTHGSWQTEMSVLLQRNCSTGLP